MRGENQSYERPSSVSGFYDICLILDAHKIDLGEAIGLVKQKEIRRPITKANVEQNWKIILTQKETEMEQIYYSRKVEDSAIGEMIKSLPLTEIA